MRSKRNPSWKTGVVRARAPKVPTLRPSTTFVFKSTACNFCLHVSLNQNKTRHRCSGGSWELWSASLNVHHCWWTLSDATLRNAHRRVNVFKFYSRYVSSCSATPFLNSTVRDPVFRLHRFVAETKRNTEFEHECGPDVVFGHTFSFFFFFFIKAIKCNFQERDDSFFWFSSPGSLITDALGWCPTRAADPEHQFSDKLESRLSQLSCCFIVTLVPLFRKVLFVCCSKLWGPRLGWRP